MNDASLTIGGLRRNAGFDRHIQRRQRSISASSYSTQRSIRSLNNQFEGFYIDDIIIGFSERGEMVTGGSGTLATRSLHRSPDHARQSQHAIRMRYPENYTGPYQMELRRSGEYAGLGDEGLIPSATTYFTNDRHIISPMTEMAFYGFESAPLTPFVSPPNVPITVGGTTVNWALTPPWTQSTASSFHGTGSATNGATSSVLPASGMQLTVNYTQAGAIRFAYTVDSFPKDNGLAFFIDGVPQQMMAVDYESPDPANPFIASGNIPYTITEFQRQQRHPRLSLGRSEPRYDHSGAIAPRVYVDDVQVLEGGTGLEGDKNKHRPQGQLILDSNFITNTQGNGINVEAGAADAAGNVPHPGSLINFVPHNQDRLVPGVVIQNNVIANAGGSGIRYFGDTSGSPSPPLPFGRIINNTIYSSNQTGTGITIDASASPTVMNNILANLATGITGGTASGAVVRSNFFQGNAANGTIGTDAILAAAGDPLFVNPRTRNFYLRSRFAGHRQLFERAAGSRLVCVLQGRPGYSSLADVRPRSRRLRPVARRRPDGRPLGRRRLRVQGPRRHRQGGRGTALCAVARIRWTMNSARTWIPTRRSSIARTCFWIVSRFCSATAPARTRRSRGRA